MSRWFSALDYIWLLADGIIQFQPITTRVVGHRKLLCTEQALNGWTTTVQSLSPIDKLVAPVYGLCLPFSERTSVGNQQKIWRTTSWVVTPTLNKLLPCPERTSARTNCRTDSIPYTAYSVYPYWHGTVTVRMKDTKRTIGWSTVPTRTRWSESWPVTATNYCKICPPICFQLADISIGPPPDSALTPKRD